MHALQWSSVLLSLGMLLGCFPRGDPSKPIPLAQIDAPQKAQRLVVVLPGRADSLDDMRRSGIAQAVHSAWPDADVILTGLALGYYMEGQAEKRLHDEIIAPARGRGYRQVWLVGASLGGMGAVMYDRTYPGAVDGMVLLAPYLGEKPLLRQIASAGGIASWQAPAVPAAVDADSFQQEMWRHLQTWSREPGKAKNVWLAYGDKDGFRDSMPLVAPLLPAGQALVRPGGHDWVAWSAVTREILTRVRARGP